MGAKTLAVALLTLLMPIVNIMASTMVETEGKDGISRIYTEGHKCRVEMPNDKGFIVVDAKENTVFLVMPAKKTIIDLSKPPNKSEPGTSDQSDKTEFKQTEAGPKIAGYETIKFDFATNGNHCGSVFVSKKALDDSGMRDIIGIFSKITTELADAFPQNPDAGSDPCKAAKASLTGKIAEIGLPLKTLYADGTLKSLVTKIEKDAELPPNPFTVPANYKAWKIGQIAGLQDRISGDKELVGQLILEQMLKPGNMSPEAIKQLTEKQMEKQKQGEK